MDPGVKPIGGAEAWKNAAKATNARWSSDIARFDEDLALVHHEPKFRLDESDRFFCIGSCFARNIEEHLIYQGVNVLSKSIFSPRDECPARTNGFVNKFTTYSMLNELEWVLNEPELDDACFEQVNGLWRDLQLAPTIPGVSRDRAYARRRYLTRDYFSRIASASVVVLTLGLNEVWYDHASQRYLNAAPSFFAARREPDRFEVQITDVAGNLVQLEQIRSLLERLNPAAKIIVTVSPVPLSETFSGKDVVVANLFSKSALRVTAQLFAARHDNIDYFPSYDMVAMSPRARAYGDDCLHVSDRVVGRIMQMFLKLYMGIERELSDFTELSYLAANPDVEEAVRAEQLSSGYEHWIRFGQAEGRAIRPADGPTDFMIVSGVARS